ncbi:hypothetical protein PISL3812_09745 [Talaromyces islandicus]|uniref:Uncharacterized protein n=1 Tax=Talaromyces islandicus TaxID=28573 RepID=A0A0U1MC48_TALIS|nr:hypothetical protein PISL3812_09745 [Talaromyces islandicus]
MLPKYIPSIGATALFLLASFATATPQLVLDSDFADPCLVQLSNGTWYAFATTTGSINIQMAYSDDFENWHLASNYDALPGPFPSWVYSSPQTWAPDVIQRADGTFLMYFSAASNDSAASGDIKHCVGAATSPNVTGPYTPMESPIACPLDAGGAIDAAGFIDDNDNQTMYVVYKVDGSNLDSGDHVYPTPIMLQEVESDGITPVGSAVQILDRDPNGGDGPLIEAPSLIKSDGIYYLTFSSAMFNTPQYDSSYAYATDIIGPWTKQHSPYAPLLVSGDASSAGALTGPGGSSIAKGGTKIAFHASRNGENADAGRAMYVANITLANDVITIL